MARLTPERSAELEAFRRSDLEGWPLRLSLVTALLRAEGWRVTVPSVRRVYGGRRCDNTPRTYMLCLSADLEGAGS